MRKVCGMIYVVIFVSFTDISDNSEDSGDEGVADGEIEEEEEVCDWLVITSLTSLLLK